MKVLHRTRRPPAAFPLFRPSGASLKPCRAKETASGMRATNPAFSRRTKKGSSSAAWMSTAAPAHRALARGRTLAPFEFVGGAYPQLAYLCAFPLSSRFGGRTSFEAACDLRQLEGGGAWGKAERCIIRGPPLRAPGDGFEALDPTRNFGSGVHTGEDGTFRRSRRGEMAAELHGERAATLPLTGSDARPARRRG